MGRYTMMFASLLNYDPSTESQPAQMKRSVTAAGEVARLHDLIATYTWAVATQHAAQRHAFRELGLRTDGSESRERWQIVEDMLNGDATPRQALDKLGITIVEVAAAAPKKAKRKRS